MTYSMNDINAAARNVILLVQRTNRTPSVDLIRSTLDRYIDDPNFDPRTRTRIRVRVEQYFDLD